MKINQPSIPSQKGNLPQSAAISDLGLENPDATVMELFSEANLQSPRDKASDAVAIPVEENRPFRKNEWNS